MQLPDPINISWWLSVSRASIAEDSPNLLKKYLGEMSVLSMDRSFSHHYSLSNTSWWPWACHGHRTLEMTENIREKSGGWPWLPQHFLQGTLLTSNGPWRTSVFKVWSSVWTRGWRSSSAGECALPFQRTQVGQHPHRLVSNCLRIKVQGIQCLRPLQPLKLTDMYIPLQKQSHH